MNPTAELAWKMICELRIETREAQKIRTQMIGIKIAFITASFGFIFEADFPTYELLLVPAFASVFFDYLIVSYGFSIKRIGYYCRSYLEPKLRGDTSWPDDQPFWEEAMGALSMKQIFASTGNLGMTAIAAASAATFIVLQAPSWGSWVFLALLGLLLSLDVYFTYWFKYTPTGDLNGHLNEIGRWIPEEK